MIGWLGFVLALLVLFLAIVFAAINQLPVIVAGLVGALALAYLADHYPPRGSP